MKPIMIVPPDVLSDESLAQLRENDLCVVVASDPAKVRFVDPIPAQSSRTQIEDAAIQLSRRILRGDGSFVNYRAEAARLYVEMLIKGTPLQPGPTKEEERKEIYDYAYAEEVRRLARADAKAERDAKKAAKK